MSELSNQLLDQLYAQDSNDPFLMLLTMTHESFGAIRFVNNVSDIVSRGENYSAFPMRVTLPVDDGETLRSVQLVFGNTSLELIDEIRTVTDPIDVNIELILASNPDNVEIEYGELKIKTVSYNSKTITANLYMDDFLNTELSSEKYTPNNFAGLFS